MFRLRKSFLISVCSLGLYSCASSQVSTVEPVSKELPAELQKKFEVLEGGPVPSPSPSVVPVARSMKGSKGKKKKTVEPVVAPFVYPDRRSRPNPIWVGEKQVLEITYIGLAAGDFTMKVLPPKTIQNRRVYHFQGTAVTSKVFNLFYRLNDVIESYWDVEGLFSHRFHMLLDESKQSRDSLELYDSEKKQAIYWNRRNHADRGTVDTKETVEIPAFPQDSFSAIYYLRTLPLEDGKVYSFPVTSEGKHWEAVITVVRREMMDTPLGKKRCIVVRPQTRYAGVMKQEKGDSFIWLTDDDRRFVVRLEAKVKVGEVAARLKEVEVGEKPNE